MLLFLILQYNGCGRCIILNFDTKPESAAFFTNFQASLVRWSLTRQKQCQKQISTFWRSCAILHMKKMSSSYYRQGITVTAEEVYEMLCDVRYWTDPANNCYPIVSTWYRTTGIGRLLMVSVCDPQLIWEGNASERNCNLKPTSSE